MLRRKIAAGLVVAGSLLAATQASAQGFSAAQVDPSVTLSGAGATFPLNFIDQTRADFKKKTGVTVNYTGVGSGAGRTQFINGTVDFGASDVAANETETRQMNKKHGGFVYIIPTAGAISIAYNVKGVPPGIKLTSGDIAKIFAGKIKRWDDAAIKDDNPGVEFPSTPIQVFVRSDNSGTSSAFTEYLDTAAKSDWDGGITGRFPTNRQQIGRSGNDGVASGIKSANGGIGYVEVSFAKERLLAMAWVKNEAGTFEYADGKGAALALAQAKKNANGTWTMPYASKAPGIYPITTVSYLLVPLKMQAKKLENFKAFMTFVLEDGQKKANKLNYIPLPANMVADAKAQLAKITKK